MRYFFCFPLKRKVFSFAVFVSCFLGFVFLGVVILLLLALFLFVFVFMLLSCFFFVFADVFSGHLFVLVAF